MCLGVPGKVVAIHAGGVGMTMGRVSFGGILKEVCLAYTPEAQVGDYVLVHVGFAISVLGEEEAASTLRFLETMGEMERFGTPREVEP
jgi:hydrogenase expression/formation protein HypC